MLSACSLSCVLATRLWLCAIRNVVSLDEFVDAAAADGGGDGV